MALRFCVVAAGVSCAVVQPVVAQIQDPLAQAAAAHYQSYVHALSQSDSVSHANSALAASLAVLQQDSSNVPALIISAKLFHLRGDSAQAYRAVARALLVDPDALRRGRSDRRLPHLQDEGQMLRTLFGIAVGERDWPTVVALGTTLSESDREGGGLAYLGPMYQAYTALQRPGRAAAVLARASAGLPAPGETWRRYVGRLRHDSDSTGGALPLIRQLLQRQPRNVLLLRAAFSLSVDAQDWNGVITTGAVLTQTDSTAAEDLAYFATLLTAHLALKQPAQVAALASTVAARFPSAGALDQWYAQQLFLGEPSGGSRLLSMLATQDPANAMLAKAAAALDSTFSSQSASYHARNPFTHYALKTPWARNVSAERVLPEYPRPQMVRRRWQNLNGRWDYAIRDSATGAPTTYDGTILVPFPIESQLSGVERPVMGVQYLWYRRKFQTPRLASGERLLLHFGAVDWEATVTVNGKQIGHHRGGYDPFSFDITDALVETGDQELVVRVWDPADRSQWPHGKQALRPFVVFFSAVTGIWQTVWLEPVPQASVRALEIVPDVDAGVVRVKAAVAGAGPAEHMQVLVSDGSQTVGTASGLADAELTVPVPKARLWSPDDPFLYDLTVSLASGDRVTSYVGMRKIAIGRDSAGISRFFLNDKPIFQLGTLDQGMWPDGLYTAPTDEALAYDIAQAKRMGFNMLRKHVKVEPARWYYHADRLGMLVWQDMPNSDYQGVHIDDLPNKVALKAQFATELERMVETLRNHPSIVTWVIFNEGWGQHDTERYLAWLKAQDPTRLVDHSSGGPDSLGDIVDSHSYPDPSLPPLQRGQASVLGEFGGLGFVAPGHIYTWAEETFSNRPRETVQDLGVEYRRFVRQLRKLKARGLAAAVYTQLTDVEAEVNGLLTYDRALVKIPADALAENATVVSGSP